MIAYKKFSFLFLLAACLFVASCDDKNKTTPEPLLLINLSVGPFPLYLDMGAVNAGTPTDKSIGASFNSPIDISTANLAFELKRKSSGQIVTLSFLFFDNNKILEAIPSGELEANVTYTLHISGNLKGAKKEIFSPITIEFTTAPEQMEINSISISGNLVTPPLIREVPVNDVSIEIMFSSSLDQSTVTAENVKILSGAESITLNFSLSDENRKLTATVSGKLKDLKKHSFRINNKLKGEMGEVFGPFTLDFYTAPDPEPDFAAITDDELLTLIQQQTFRYFWDFAHPASGMARERNSSGDIVTSGGSGFGIMALIVGIERDFISRQQGLDHLKKILDFLETADRFHGAWPHWMNGNSGAVVPFSIDDNGGDLVETSFLIQGLITIRQYLDAGSAPENLLIDRINALWHTVEWEWYTKGGASVLYWHWSPDKAWVMNHPVRGYNEALITYFLAAASPTHPIGAVVYHEGWANKGGIVNNKTFYNIKLPLGFDYGGPLFFSHYSFLGLDPRNLSDTYANYWTQNVNHSLINYAYAVANPKNYLGYSDNNWGLTASDNHIGYSAHSPTNDLGVITPTAALSSFPYTPAESMKALKFFYYTVGDRLWGSYGFYDAFNLTEGWTANSYLAIDQGPIIVMIENYRTGLLWDLFMSAPEIQTGMETLGFSR